MSRFLRIDVRWSAVLTGVVVLAALLVALSGPGALASPSADGPGVSSGLATSHVELAAAQTDRGSLPSTQPFDVSIDTSTAQLVSAASIEDLGPVGGPVPSLDQGNGSHVSPAQACNNQDILVNGGFELGPSIGWTLASNVATAGQPWTTAQVILNESAFGGQNVAPEGTWLARLGMVVNAEMQLYQSAPVPMPEASTVVSATLEYLITMVKAENAAEEPRNGTNDDYLAPFFVNQADTASIIPQSVFSEEVTDLVYGRWYRLRLPVTDLVKRRTDWDTMRLLFLSKQNADSASIHVLDAARLVICGTGAVPTVGPPPVVNVTAQMGLGLDEAACTLATPGTEFPFGTMEVCGLVKWQDAPTTAMIRYQWHVDDEEIPVPALNKTFVVGTATGCDGDCLIATDRTTGDRVPVPSGRYWLEVFAGDVSTGATPKATVQLVIGPAPGTPGTPATPPTAETPVPTATDVPPTPTIFLPSLSNRYDPAAPVD